MRRIVLFSAPIPGNISVILGKIFPAEIKDKILAYMPSDGANCPQKYLDEWKKYAQQHDAQFRKIDNSQKDTAKEAQKLLGSNILVISGGNTFKLLYLLRRSRLDKAIKEFSHKKEFVLSGFSAGALVLTPTIEVCNLPNYDSNLVGLKDLVGLGIVDFEIFPHYDEAEHKRLLEDYKKIAKHKIREITNESYLVVDL